MANQNINFKKRTYDQIFLSLLVDGYNEGLLSTDANFLEYIQNDEDVENILILDYSIIAYQLSLFYDDAELIYQSKDLDLARGIDLDNIGKEKGISRPGATSPETLITFYTKSTTSTEEIIIPKGTRVANLKSDSPIYRTLETVSFTPVSAEKIVIKDDEWPCVQVNSRCETTGTSGHVNAEELTEIVDSGNISKANLYCVNTRGSSGGRSAYSDDKYRELLRKWVTVFQRGNLDCYVNYLERVDGLDSYNLIPRWNYPGTIKIVADPNTRELLNRIATDCENTIGLCKEAVTVVGATETQISINCIVNVDIDQVVPYTTIEKEAIGEKVKQAIYEYVMGYHNNIENVHYNGLTIGQDFIPYWCGIYVAGRINEVKSVNFLDTSIPYTTDESTGKIIYYPAENIPIGEEEIATISLDNISVTVQ